MQTNTHTNGPWKFYLYGKDSQGRTIATVGANDGNNRICEICPYDLPLSDVAANAHLIAAAPDLLAAAIAALTIVNREQPDGSIAADLLKAIRKAKGGA